MTGPSLQERLAPNSICFGCGPANEKGLKIRSFEDGDMLVCEWHAQPHHEAFPGMLNGGITGAILDCHSNWAAAWSFMRAEGLAEIPSCVTAEYAIRLRRPIPTNGPIFLRAKVVETSGDKAIVEATLEAGGKPCASCRGTFVRVRPGHPAYHRWA